MEPGVFSDRNCFIDSHRCSFGSDRRHHAAVYISLRTHIYVAAKRMAGKGSRGCLSGICIGTCIRIRLRFIFRRFCFLFRFRLCLFPRLQLLLIRGFCRLLFRCICFLCRKIKHSVFPADLFIILRSIEAIGNLLVRFGDQPASAAYIRRNIYAAFR